MYAKLDLQAPIALNKFYMGLYEGFLIDAFPRMCQRLGIVYTPVEVIDFILNSVDDALRNEFGVYIGSEGVELMDPFTGTGAFITRLIQSDLIADEDLERMYRSQIFANEIVSLAYALAGINIEDAYYRRTGKREAFSGLSLADTFLT